MRKHTHNHSGICISLSLGIEWRFIKSEQNRKKRRLFWWNRRIEANEYMFCACVCAWTMEICSAMSPIVSKMKAKLLKAISYLVANDKLSILIWWWFPLITLKCECFDSKSANASNGKDGNIGRVALLPFTASICLTVSSRPFQIGCHWWFVNRRKWERMGK